MTRNSALFVLLISLAGIPASGAPPGSSDSSALAERWQEHLEKIKKMARTERWKAARKASTELVEEMAMLYAVSAKGRVNLALVETYKAAAEAAAGRLDDALWSWQIAQNLNPALRQSSLPDLGAATALLEQHRLRAAGTLPEHVPGDGPDAEPPVPLDVPLPRVPRTLSSHWHLNETDIEILVDTEGRVQSPVVLGGELPGKIYHSLEILRHWRFRPAQAGGTPVPALMRLRDLGEGSLPFRAVRSERLRPIHELLVARRWQEARDASQGRIDESLSDPVLVSAFRDALPAAIGTTEAGTSGRELWEALALRAVAEAGAGRGEEALWTWSMSHSFDCSPSSSRCRRSTAGLEIYGEAGRWLAARPPCHLAAERDCEAHRLAADPDVTPPRVAGAPALRLPTDLSPERLAAEIFVDAEGRPREARLIAGHSRAGGYLALEALREWRFEPARRGGESVAAFFETSIPLAPAAAPEEVERWRRALDRIAEVLVAGDYADAAAELPGLIGELSDAIGAGGSDLLARALTELAVAEAGLGREELAVWHWHMAQNLALEYRHHDLSAFGAAGAVLARHRLRYPGEAPAEGPWAGSRPREPKEPPRTLAAPEPKYPDAGDGAGDVAEIEILLDEAGRPHAPVVLRGGTPRLLVAALEALRGWRFEPPASAEPPVLHRVVLPLIPRRPFDALKLVPEISKLANLAITTESQGKEYLAGCLWHAAQSLDADLTAAELPPQAAGLADQILLPADAWTYGERRGSGTGVHHVTGRVQPPVKVSAPQPRYTDRARARRRQGTVVMHAVIDKQGHVARLRVVSGVDPIINVETVKAVCQWQFQPARLDGDPIDVHYNLTTSFRLR